MAHIHYFHGLQSLTFADKRFPCVSSVCCRSNLFLEMDWNLQDMPKNEKCTWSFNGMAHYTFFAKMSNHDSAFISRFVKPENVTTKWVLKNIENVLNCLNEQMRKISGKMILTKLHEESFRWHIFSTSNKWEYSFRNDMSWGFWALTSIRHFGMIIPWILVSNDTKLVDGQCRIGHGHSTPFSRDLKTWKRLNKSIEEA